MTLILEDVKKNFEKKEVLKGVTGTFEKGKIYGLVGRNGAGKTTLFNCIAKDTTLDGGEIYLINEAGEKESYDAIDISYVYATSHLPGFMTAVEFLRYYKKVNRKNLREPEKKIETYLDEVGILKEDRNLLMKDYSHGMKNKIQILLSLMIAPKVLLLDEPLTSFDPVAAKEMKDVIRSIKKDTIIIFSTHVLQLAQELCDEVYLLHDKKLRLLDATHLKDANFEEEVVALLQGEED